MFAALRAKFDLFYHHRNILGELLVGQYHYCRCPGPRLNINTDRLSHVWGSHVKDKTVARPSYLWHGDPCIGKSASLYWDAPWLLVSPGHQHSLHWLYGTNMSLFFMQKYSKYRRQHSTDKWQKMLIYFHVSTSTSKSCLMLHQC